MRTTSRPNTLEGFVFPGTADLSVPIPPAPNQANGYTPDTIARFGGNFSANAPAAWYANIQGTTGTSTVYEPAQFFPGTLSNGRVTPGQANVSLFAPITPGNGSLAVNVGASGKLSAADLATLATGGSGALTVTSVQSPTARGGSVSIQNGWIVDGRPGDQRRGQLHLHPQRRHAHCPPAP